MRSCQRRRINMMNNELMQISRIKIDQTKYRFCVEENIISDSAINIVDINFLTHEITCSCDDAKSYNNMHMQIICKHGCFILIKVLELFNDESQFFINMTFTNDDIAMIPNKILNLHPSLITDNPSLITDNNIDHLFNIFENDNSESDTDYSDSDLSSLQQTIMTPFIQRYALSNNESEKNSCPKLNSQLKKKLLIKTENKIFLKDESCPVCFEQLNKTDVIKCSYCNNYVHTECIKTWLLKNNSCILCRENIKNDILHTINLKHKCECGSIIHSSYIKKHLLTKKHLNFISPNN